MASIFQNVDKSQVPTKHLKEFGYNFLPMDVFNGVLADTNVLDMTAWRLLYGAFYTSYVGTSHPIISELSAVNTTIKNYETGSDAIPISLLYVNYNDLRPDAITANLLTGSNEQLFDVIGRTAIPFRSQTLFAAAASFEQSYTATTKFIFNCDLIFSNLPGTFCSTSAAATSKASGASSTKIVVSPPGGGGGGNPTPITPLTYTVSVDFADGAGFRNVTMGVPISASWAYTGDYKLKVKVTSSTGTVVQSWFQFTCNSVPCTNCFEVGKALELQDGNFAASTNQSSPNAHSGGHVYYELSKNNHTGRIVKPLIVAEGFDAHFAAPHFKDKNYDINDFIREMIASNILDANNRTLSDKLDLDEIASYDLVFIDYNNGTDDIKRNAILFQNVVHQVNLQKQYARASGYTTYANVVLGSSMGGLVTRYGLADIVRNGYRIERSNHNPETGILLTHDTPHHGANVPLAIQFMARRAGTFSRFNTNILSGIAMKDLAPIIDDVNTLLNQPAPQQMLIYYAANEYSSSVTKNIFLSANGEYRTMVDNIPFSQNGITPYQMIAMSNGSQCGTQIFGPNTSLLNAQVDGFVNTRVTSHFPLQFGLGATVSLHSSAMQAVNEVAYWRLYGKIRIYLALFPITVDITLNDYHANSPSFAIAYDGSAGGTTAIPISNIKGNISTVIGNGTVLKSTLGLIADIFLPTSINLTVPQKEFSFIPTGSALDADNFIDNPLAVNQNYSNNFNPNYPPHFNGFIAQNFVTSYLTSDGTQVTGNFYNTPHISFQPKNSIWLYEKLTNSTPSGAECSTECGKPTIIGANIVCGTTNLSINSGGIPVTWTATPTGIVDITTSNNGTATITKLAPGRITLTASFQSGACTINSAPLNIEVGAPSPASISLSPSPFNIRPCKGTTLEFHATPYDNSINYTWVCTGNQNCGSIYPGGTGNNYADFALPYAPTASTFTFDVSSTYTNGCGTSLPITQTNFVQFGTSCPSFLKVGISPNPAQNTLSLNVVDTSPAVTASSSSASTSTLKADPSFQVTISDLVGNIKYERKHTTADSQIDISGLKTGNYSLRVIKQTDVVTKTFSVVK